MTMWYVVQQVGKLMRIVYLVLSTSSKARACLVCENIEMKVPVRLGK